MTKHFVGITGRKRHGKNTVADILVAERGYVIVSFAEPVYRMVYALDSQVGNSTVRKIVDSVGWEDAKNWYPEIRRQLQYMGTEAGREVLGENLWVNDWWRRARAAGPRVVAPDVRYDNEAAQIARVRGRILHVDRPGFQDPDATNGSHSSEAGVDPRFISHRLTNVEGQQDQLRLQVLMAVDGVSW